MEQPKTPFREVSKWWKKPAAVRDERQKLVGLIHLIVFITCTICGITMLLAGMDAYPTLFLMGFVSFAGWALNRAGFQRLPAVVLLAAVLVGVQYNIFQGYGMHDVGIIAWPAFIFFAGLLLGSRAIPFLTALVMLLSVMTRVLPNAESFVGDSENGDLVVMLLILAAFGLIASLFQPSNERSMHALGESGLKYRMLFEQASDGIIYLSTEHKVLAVNESFARMHGYRVEEMQGMDLKDLDGPETARLMPDRIRRVLAGETLEFGVQHYHKDGHLFPLEVSTSLVKVGDERYIQAFHRDSTERRVVEKELLDSTERLKEAQRIGHIGNWELDLVTNQLLWSDEIFRIFEIDPAVFGASYEAFLEGIHPDDREAVNRAYASSLETRIPYDIDHRLLMPDGRVKYVHERCETSYSAEGQPLRSVGTVQDNTERVMAEKALRESQELQSLFMRHSPIYAYIKDVTPTEDRLLQASANLNELLGVPSSEVLTGRTMEELFPADFAAKISADDWAVVAKGEVLKLDEDLGGRHYTTIKFPLELGRKTLLAGYTIDITERKRAEEALRIGEERYHNLFNQSIVVVSDTEGRWTEISPLFCELVGYSQDELLGMSFAQITHPDDLAANLELNERIARGEVDNFILEKRYLHKSGKVVWANLSKTSVRDASGAPFQSITVIQDITMRKEAEEAMRESESRFRAVVEQSPVGIGVFNLDGIGLYANRKYLEILGMKSVEDLIGRPAAELYAPQCREESRERIRRRSQGLPVAPEFESTGLRADGSQFPVHLVAAPIQLAGSMVTITFLTDLTERKRAEEDRIARELADRANRAKSEFLSRMSHELRTPLNAILGFAQLLKMDEPRPDQERGVDQINKSGRHLLHLVNEVLDIAKIEAGKMRLSPEPIQLEAVVKEALELIRPLAEARHISLSFEATSKDDPSVLADQQGLRQVLLNLLSNAVKYNREGGEIAVTIRTTQDGHLRLQVKDTGQGIAPEKIGRLFVPFDRLDMEAVEQEGTGLGLALSKGLMEAMGGRIGAESMFGEGSTFWLELKVVEA
jgi:PAS domain S-box-containing protein